jgi:hypothetical protein
MHLIFIDQPRSSLSGVSQQTHSVYTKERVNKQPRERGLLLIFPRPPAVLALLSSRGRIRSPIHVNLISSLEKKDEEEVTSTYYHHQSPRKSDACEKGSRTKFTNKDGTRKLDENIGNEED